MSTAVRKLVIRWFVHEVLNTGNVAAVDELFSHDYLAHVPVVPRPLRGTASWKERMATYFAAFPDLHITVEEILAEDEQVAARLTWRGTHRGAFLGRAPSRRHVHMAGIGIWRISGGKMVEEWSAEDLLGLLAQLGQRKSPTVKQRPEVAWRSAGWRRAAGTPRPRFG
jgi:steroid delta-isomerase-like uncharacterized protein